MGFKSFCTTPVVAFSVTDIICERPKLDFQRSQSVMSVNCQYDTIHKHKCKPIYHMTFSIAHWDS